MSDTLLAADCVVNEIGFINKMPQVVKRLTAGRFKRQEHISRMLSVGTAPTWLVMANKKFKSLALSHYNGEASASAAAGMPVRNYPPNELTGNHSVWMVYRALLKTVSEASPSNIPSFTEYFALNDSAARSAARRLGGAVTPSEKLKIVKRHSEVAVESAKLIAAIQGIRESHTSALKKSTEFLKACAKGSEEEKIEFVVKIPEFKMKMASVGAVCFISISKKTYVLTQTHFHRVVRMLETALATVHMSPELATKEVGLELVSSIAEALSDLVDQDVDSVGSALKGARTWYASKLDRSPSLGRNAPNEFLLALKPDRRNWVREVGPAIRSLCTSVESTINLLGMYKTVPHPDANLYEVFAAISGLKNPNRSDPGQRARFKATVRRNLYSSMKSQGFDVRLRSVEPGSQKLAELANATRVDVGRVKGSGHAAWAGVVFEKVQGLPDIDEMEVPVSSKASQQSFGMTEEDLLNAKASVWTDSVKMPENVAMCGTINDAVSVLKGSSKLDNKRATERFEKVVKLHEEFEAKFGCALPEDIPSDKLEEFLMKNPSARYLVGSEPKFGEAHKKITRLFYIAEQELKVMTQRTERMVRTVSRRQPGVSIVKTYPGRRKDLEHFAKSVSGDSPPVKSIFVSFDMSEFSKKFPMDLVRAYGEVMAELTGVDWFRRLDLVFRASVVMHKSRGYFDYISGVKGGFEGFLNFVWSSIHASIMEIALEATGLNGDLLTFSDDGLLLFYTAPGMAGAEIMKKVYAVQRIYKLFGLEFNMGKTLISTNCWEYLGDVCVNGRLLPTWFKEALAINRIDASSGLEPLYTRIRAIDAQEHAYLSAGGPPIAGYILKRIFCSLALKRLGVEISQQTEEVIFMLPSSAGGLRITGPGEDVCFSQIPRDSEVEADLRLLQMDSPDLVKTVLAELVNRKRKSKDTLSALLSATCFVTDHPDTSGMGILNEAIDLIGLNPEVVKRPSKSPLKGQLGTRLKSVIPHIANLDLDVISSLIYSTPLWKEYTNSLSLVQSRGAIRLISHRSIKSLQAADTRNVARSLSMWEKCIRLGVTTRRNTQEVMAILTRSALPGLNVAYRRPSPRLVLRATDGTGKIEIRADGYGSKTEFTAEYSEPVVRFPVDVSSISWASQSGGSTSTRNLREYLASVAKVLAFSPESLTVIKVVSSVCGIETPNVPTGLTRGAHRPGSTKPSGVDIKTVIPRWYQAISTSRYVGEAGRRVASYERADRSTYLCYATAFAYFRWVPNYGPNSVTNYYNYDFDFDLVDAMHETVPMVPLESLPDPFETSPIPEDFKREFLAGLVEHTAYLESLSTIAQSNVGDGLIDDNDRLMLNSLTKRSLVTWISRALRDASSNLIEESHFPAPLSGQLELVKSSIVEAALQMVNPILRSRLVARLLQEPDMELEPEDYGNYMDDAYNDEGFLELVTFVENAKDLVSAADVPGIGYAQLEFLENDHHYIATEVLDQSRKKSLLDGGRLVVIRGSTFPLGRVSPAHRTAFREAFTNTITRIMAAGKNNRWNMELARQSLGLRSNPDDCLDFLFVCRGLLRASQHRSIAHPYNTTSSKICMWKFYRALYDISANVGRRTKVKDMRSMAESWRIRALSLRYLNNYFSAQGRKLGPDHASMLTQPLSHEEVSRVVHHLKSVRTNHRIGTLSGADGQPWYQVSMDDVNRILTGNYAELIARASEQLVEYPTTLERRLVEQYTPSTPSTLHSLNLHFQSRTYPASSINLLSDPSGPEIASLVSEHIRIHCVRNFVHGVAAVGGGSQLLYNSTAEMTRVGGDTVGDLTDTEYRGLAVFALRTYDVKSALISYGMAARERGSSVSIFKDISLDDEGYVICGVTQARGIIVGVTDPISRIQGNAYELERLVPSITMRAEINMVRNISLHSTLVVGQEMPVSSRIKMIAQMSRRVGTSPQVNENSNLLQAVVESARHASPGGQVLACYVGLKLALQGGESEALLMSEIGRINRVITRERSQLTYSCDIALCMAWLRGSSIQPGIGIDLGRVQNYCRIISMARSTIDTPMAAISLKMNTLSWVLERSTGSVLDVGHVADSLYMSRRTPNLRITDTADPNEQVWGDLLAIFAGEASGGEESDGESEEVALYDSESDVVELADLDRIPIPTDEPPPFSSLSPGELLGDWADYPGEEPVPTEDLEYY